MKMSRREFVQSVAAVSAGVAVAKDVFGQTAGGGSDDINVAIIGTGRQGRILLKDTLKIPGIRFKAVCDIWEYNKGYAARRLEKYKHEVNAYIDFQEMLDKEKDLDAVIIATPDWVHAEHTIACLKAGKHVYCEKEMSNNLENAKNMVLTARETGKLLQIGHQRRSNPVYQIALKMIEKDDLCGRLTNLYGQWSRPVQDKLKWKAKYAMPAEDLKKYGYDSMDHFFNWRWYKKYSAGPIADLGSHQIDIFSWFLDSDPTSVVAVGGSDFYADRDWYEDVLCIYEYNHKHKGKIGTARAFYQVLNTNGFLDYYEKYGGTKGTIMLSENPKQCLFSPERGQPVPDWMSAQERQPYGQSSVIPLLVMDKEILAEKSPVAAKMIKEWIKKNVHQLHLENFFAAVRAGNKKMLTCPGEAAYATAVAVLSVLPAIKAGNKHMFKEGDFKV